MWLTHFSLFTGIGGIDLAAEWAGFQTVGQCEIDDYCVRVLEKHWPTVPKWRDIRNVAADSIREAGIERIDLLSGGFPRQPHSVAGKRRASSDERNLWSEFARVICEVKPKWVLAENVRGLLSSEAGRFFGGVLGDLAELGYHAAWGVWGADSVEAPHRRHRVFIVAYTEGEQDRGIQLERFQPHTRAENQSIGDSERVRLSGHDWRTAQSRLGRDSNGLSGGMDCRWPAGPGEKQHNWEPPRICGRKPNRTKRLKALGNAVVPQQCYPILKAIADIERGRCGQ